MHKKTSNFDRVFIEALLHLCVCVCVFNQSTSSTFLLIEIFEQWIGTTTQIKCGNLYLPESQQHNSRTRICAFHHMSIT